MDPFNEPSRHIGGAFLRSAPIASYALAQLVVVGYWAYTVSEYGVDPKPDFDPDLLGAFLITAIPVVPSGGVYAGSCISTSE